MRFRIVIAAILAAGMSSAGAQELATHFSCSQPFDDQGIPSTLADVGEIRIRDNRLESFYWESTLYRKTHGIECSINLEDGVQLEPIGDDGARWRLTLKDGVQARVRRGYGYEHGVNCSIRLDREGDTLHIRPTCPALCGSRQNFSELTVEIKSGNCHQEE